MKQIYIVLVSDSHGRSDALRRMADAAPDVAAWLHSGDYCEDAEILASYSGVPVYAIRGNNDFRAHEYVDCRNVNVGGVTITMIHGHQWYGDERIQKLTRLGKKNNAQMVMFGHTHRKFLKNVEGIVIVNPGSIALSRDSRKGTYGICTIADGTIMDMAFYELS